MEKQYGGSAQAAADAGTGGITQLKNLLGDLTEDFGKIIVEAITPFIGFLKSLGEEFKSLSPEAKRTVVIFAALAAAVGPVLIIVGKLSIGIGALISLFRTLGIASKVAGLSIKGALVATGIGALVVGLGFVVAKVLELRSELGSFQKVFDVIKLQLQRFLLQTRKTFSDAGTAVGNFFRRLVGRPEVKAATDELDAQISQLDSKIDDIYAKANQRAESSEVAKPVLTPVIDEAAVLAEYDEKKKIAQERSKKDPIKVKTEITIDEEIGIGTAIVDGGASANQNAILDAQLRGAAEEEVNAIRLNGLMDYQTTLQVVLMQQQQFYDEVRDPAVQDSITSIKEKLKTVGDEIKEINQTPLDIQVDRVEAQLNNVPSLAEGATSAFASFASQANSGFQNLASTGLNGITQAFTEIVDGTKTASQAFQDFGKTVLDTLIRIAIQKAITAAIGSAFGPSDNFTGDVGLAGIPGFSTGGAVMGPGSTTSDSILAKLSNKEYVLRASSAQDLGLPFLNAINRFGSKGLAKYLSDGMSAKMGAFRNKASSAKGSFRAPKFQDGGEVNVAQNRQGGMPNLVVNIENRSQARVSAIQPEGPSGRDAIRGLVYDIILEDAAVGGPLTRAGR